MTDAAAPSELPVSSTAEGRTDAPGAVPRRRWLMCALLFCAFTINYVDRQVLSILKPVIQRDLGWSEVDYANIALAFQVAYLLGMMGVGRLIDAFGVRRVMSGSILLWGLAAMAHGLMSTVAGFGAMRFLLALGESANLPAGVRAMADWFPKRERGLANGLFNAGGNVGTIVAALIVPALALTLGWRWAFVATGALAIALLVAWRILYRAPEADPRLSPAELDHIRADPDEAPATKIPLSALLRTRQLWALAVVRAMTDPVWAFLLFWLPDFFSKRHCLDLAGYGPPLIAVYLLGDIGSVGGGWLSTRLMAFGWSANVARKATLLVCAACVLPAMALTSIDSVALAVFVLGVIAAAHQGWSVTLYTIVGDVFPRGAVASVVSICSAVAGLGVLVMIRFVGTTLQAGGNYALLFTIVGGAYLCAFALLCVLLPRLTSAFRDEVGATAHG